MEPVYAGEVVTGEVMCEREVEIDVPYGQVVGKQGQQGDLALEAAAPPEPPAPEPPSTATAWIWTEHAGLDPWGDRVRQAMSRVRYAKIDNWRAAHSLEDLKRVAKREGYSAFFVGSSPHAVMLSVPFELTPDQCRESAGCTLYLLDHAAEKAAWERKTAAAKRCQAPPVAAAPIPTVARPVGSSTAPFATVIMPPGRYPATAHVRWTWGHRPHGFSGFYCALNVREGGHWECEGYPGYRGQLRPVSDARRAVIAGRFPSALRVWEGPYRSHHPSTFGHGTQRWMLLPTGLLRVDHAVDCSSGWPDYEADGYTYYFAPPQALLDGFGLQADTTFRTSPRYSSISIGTSTFGRLSVDELVGDWCSLSCLAFPPNCNCALYEIIKVDEDHYRERGCCFFCAVPLIPFDQHLSRVDVNEKLYTLGLASTDSNFIGPCAGWRGYSSPDSFVGTSGYSGPATVCGWRRDKFSCRIFRDLLGIQKRAWLGYRPPPNGTSPPGRV